MIARRTFLASGVGGLAAATACALVGAEAAGGSSADDPGDADIGFCTDMAAHHVQALAMCQRALGRDTGDAVQAAAAEILQNQAIEVGMMRAWLTDWGVSTAPPAKVMGWMHDGMEMPIEAMPGYASDAEMQALSAAAGDDLARRWLELMRAHHVGGVSMAAAATELATSEKVIRLARTQASTQSWEIEQFDLMLAAVG